MTSNANDTVVNLTRSGDASRINPDVKEHSGRKGDRVEANHRTGSLPLADPEETDLERRVLAHERILQALIAHMAESEPKFFERLAAAFSDPARAVRREHDFTDTDAYADQFIRKIKPSADPSKAPAVPVKPEMWHSPDLEPIVDVTIEHQRVAATLLELTYRAGVWEVTKDGNFYAHYLSQQPAFDAIEATAHAIVASGGCADILLRGERSRRGGAGPTAPSSTKAVDDVGGPGIEAAADSAVLLR